MDENNLNKVKEQVEELMQKGYTNTEANAKLAEQYGVTPFTIYNWSHPEFREEQQEKRKQYMKDYNTEKRGYKVIKIPYNPKSEKVLESIPIVEYDTMKEQG